MSNWVHTGQSLVDNYPMAMAVAVGILYRVPNCRSVTGFLAVAMDGFGDWCLIVTDVRRLRKRCFWFNGKLAWMDVDRMTVLDKLDPFECFHNPNFNVVLIISIAVLIKFAKTGTSHVYGGVCGFQQTFNYKEICLAELRPNLLNLGFLQALAWINKENFTHLASAII